MFRRANSVVIALFFLTASAIAQAERRHGQDRSEIDSTLLFEHGQREFQAGLGYFSSEDKSDFLLPQVIDIDASARFGWMLTGAPGKMPIPGNLEVLADVIAGTIVEGPGQIIAGLTGWLRYNYVPPRSRLIPYFQVGVGALYSDAHEQSLQREIGSAVSYNLQAGLGARYLLSDKTALFLEGDYRHISNADSADRNRGLNSGGFWIGVTYFH